MNLRKKKKARKQMKRLMKIHTRQYRKLRKNENKRQSTEKQAIPFLNHLYKDLPYVSMNRRIKRKGGKGRGGN